MWLLSSRGKGYLVLWMWWKKKEPSSFRTRAWAQALFGSCSHSDPAYHSHGQGHLGDVFPPTHHLILVITIGTKLHVSHFDDGFIWQTVAWWSPSALERGVWSNLLLRGQSAPREGTTAWCEMGEESQSLGSYCWVLSPEINQHTTIQRIV